MWRTAVSDEQPAPRRDPRDETIQRALANAMSPEGRADARRLIAECGSPVVAAREVFLAYAEAAEASDTRYTIACQAGCWFCCVTPVAATVFEAAMVLSAVLTLPEEQQQRIRERLDARIAAQDTALTEAPNTRVRFLQRCPLLNESGECSVYEARPLACRSLLSGDAERCRRHFLENDSGDPQETFTLTNNAALVGVPQLMVTLNEGRLDHYPSYELGSTLHKLWADPASFAAWQRGARFSSNGSPRMAEGQEIFPAPDDLPLGPPE